MLSSQEQIKNQIDSAENILILTAEKTSASALASSWGMAHLLKSLGKKPVVLKRPFPSEKISFLKAPDQMKVDIKGARDFIISFSTKKSKILKVRTEEKEETFDILVTPERESIDPRDFSIIPAKFKYDLTIIIGSPDLESLGKIRDDNSDLFFEVPIVNIDNSSSNDNFGQINLVDISASSAAEILANLSKKIWEKHVGPSIAQCFLAGIISATSNFQNKKTTPRTLMTASWLIEKGANQQEIIRRLFKTHSFSFMKLWGRVMARLSWDEKLKLIWSMVSIEDFVQSRSKPADLPLILEKIKDNFSAGKFFAILYPETLEKSIVIIKNSDSESLKKIREICGGEVKNGHLEISFEGKNVLEAEKELLDKIRSVS